MSIPWWKNAPTPPTGTPAAADPEADAKPWAEEPVRPAPAPTRLRANAIRCSAPGCGFVSDASTTATLGGGLRPFCQHHATGGELVIADLMWCLPCACGRVADGFQQVVGGFSATHTAARCLQRTVEASPDDVTGPGGSGPPARPVDRVRTMKPRCACGKSFDGTANASAGFVENHSVRECIEMTLVPGEAGLG